MNAEQQDKKLPAKVEYLQLKYLQRERAAVIALPPEKALERILDAAEPVALVHSFPEQDLHFLIHDIGAQDALPLLSLASDRQWEYIVDMETWDRDRINIAAAEQWLDLLCSADMQRAIMWLVQHKTELLEFYLLKNIEVRIREHDQDPSEFGKEFFTLDNTFYVRITGDRAKDNSQPGDIDRKQHKNFIVKFLESLAEFDHITYQKILLEAGHILEAETEEEAYRRRNVRLAEKGFLPFDEAVGIYQPLKPQDLAVLSDKSDSRPLADRTMPVPLFPADMLEEDNLFARALTQVDAEAVLQRLQAEFASLCNQIVAADHKQIRSKQDLRPVVRKACGYIAIGLQAAADEPTGPAGSQETIWASLIQNHLLSNIFRVGYGRALSLKWRAQKWLDKSWFAANGLSLTFWGEEWLGVLGGLLLKKPLFFDNYKTGVLYREFGSMDDVREVEIALSDIIACDNLLSLMEIQLEPVSSYRLLTFKNLWLTLWVRNYTGLSADARPITLKEFKPFYEKLWTAGEKPLKIRRSMKEACLRWLAEQSGLGEYEISQILGQVLETLFLELEDEYGQVAAADLDPRFVYLFLLEG
jgi:hypothetical protein